MSHDESNQNDKPAQNAKHEKSQKPSGIRSFFSLPPAVKRIFDHFPLVTYDANELPILSPRNREEHALYVFIDSEDAKLGRASYNPSCLKWQTYLKLAGTKFRVVASSNHASPSGSLPFVLTAAANAKDGEAVPAGNTLKKWVEKEMGKGVVQESRDVRYEAYLALVEGRVRKAWLYQLYLTPQNSDLVRRLYVFPCSSMPPVQMAIASHLRSAAEAELIKSSGINSLSAIDLIRDADEAFSALSALLGQNEWFFGQAKPGLFDASVFAYTHLILDESLEWKLNELKDALEKYSNLVRHRERIEKMYF